jgi:transposase
MVRRHELTDEQWARLEPLMPPNGLRGGQWADHRTVINGVLFRVRTSVPWRDLPERYGPWQTVYERHRRWSADGTWQHIADTLRIDADTGQPRDSRDSPDWTVSADSTVVRAHQHAAGARHTPPRDIPEKRGAVRARTPMGGRRWGVPGAA